MAKIFAKRVREAVRCGAGGQPTWFQHDDGLAAEPGLGEQLKRYPRGLAGAGRRDKDGTVGVIERLAQVRERDIDRKGLAAHESTSYSAHGPSKMRLMLLYGGASVIS